MMAVAPGASNKTERVQLYLYASKLRNVAGMFHGVSDPFCVVTLLANDPTEKPRVLGKTEVIKNTLDPKWTTTFLLDFEFGKPTRVNVGIYDEVNKGKNNKPMGSALFEIGEVLASRGNTKAKTLKNGGTLFARVVKAAVADAGTFNLALRGVQLKNVDGMFGKSDPFFELSSQANSAGGLTWQPVYRSQPVMNDLNPKWERMSISMNTLCDGDRSKPILVTVKDWEKSGRHHTMGSFETSVNGLLGAMVSGGGGANAKTVDTSKAFTLNNRGKSFGKIVVIEASVAGGNNVSHASNNAQTNQYAQSSPYASSSVDTAAPFSQALNRPAPGLVAASTGMSLSGGEFAPLPPPLAPPSFRPNFIDYISGGCDLQMCVAIDFTGSNGDPRRPGTLHYIHHDGQMNDYEKAITAVGTIIARYDSDQMFPVLGFGAKFGGVIQHCFQVGTSSEVRGVRGIIEAYRNVFQSGLTMSGPTVFAEVIDIAAAQARSKQEAASRIGKQAYAILLILTDGAVSDIDLTQRAIIAASSAPLSIVIVGIGNADFSAMQFLDDLGGPNSSGRDICQFVEFSKHQFNKTSLTRETLAEIPDQLVDYFYGHGIKPLPPISGSRVSIIPDEYNDDDIDLSIDVNDDGDISLAQPTGAVYDDTQYGTLHDYTGSTYFRPPSQPVAPPAHGFPGGPTVVGSSDAYVPNAPTFQSQQYGYQQGPSGYQPSAPQDTSYRPAQQQHGYQSQQPHAYQPDPSSQPYSSYQAAYQPSQSNVYDAIPTATAAVVPPKFFNVQVPPGVSPGTQLQVRNPVTQQMQIITVPQGVPPGGVFPVHY